MRIVQDLTRPLEGPIREVCPLGFGTVVGRDLAANLGRFPGGLRCYGSCLARSTSADPPAHENATKPDKRDQDQACRADQGDLDGWVVPVDVRHRLAGQVPNYWTNLRQVWLPA